MQFKNIEEVFKAFEDLNVLVIGDVMIDAYVYGTVNRISPEAPVPVVNVKKRESRLGGAANVARNLVSLGAKATLCSVIGDDLYADQLIKLSSDCHISTDGLIRSNHRPTTVKYRVLSGSQHMLRIDEEKTDSLNDKEKKQFLSKLESLIGGTDLIIFEDYDKGLLDQEIISSIIGQARQLGIPTAVDPKKKNFLHYAGASLFKPNLKELFEGLKIPFSKFDLDEIKSAIYQLSAEMPTDLMMVTLSENGVLIKETKEYHHIPAHIRSISDVSGAGDTVISIAGLCLALKLPSKFIGELSNLGGGLVCEHLGVVPINKERLISEALKYQILPHS